MRSRSFAISSLSSRVTNAARRNLASSLPALQSSVVSVGGYTPLKDSVVVVHDQATHLQRQTADDQLIGAVVYRVGCDIRVDDQIGAMEVKSAMEHGAVQGTVGTVSNCLEVGFESASINRGSGRVVEVGTSVDQSNSRFGCRASHTSRRAEGDVKDWDGGPHIIRRECGISELVYKSNGDDLDRHELPPCSPVVAVNLYEVERYVLIPYDAETFDCADLVLLVQCELFGRTVNIPGRRPRGARGSAELHTLARPYARRRQGRAVDGDLVLMIDHGQQHPGHAGVYFFLAHEGWVLHTNEKIGCSVLHRVRDLSGFGLRIEGFYEWV